VGPAQPVIKPFSLNAHPRRSCGLQPDRIGQTGLDRSSPTVTLRPPLLAMALALVLWSRYPGSAARRQASARSFSGDESCQGIAPRRQPGRSRLPSHRICKGPTTLAREETASQAAAIHSQVSHQRGGSRRRRQHVELCWFHRAKGGPQPLIPGVVSRARLLGWKRLWRTRPIEKGGLQSSWTALSEENLIEARALLSSFNAGPRSAPRICSTAGRIWKETTPASFQRIRGTVVASERRRTGNLVLVTTRFSNSPTTCS